MKPPRETRSLDQILTDTKVQLEKARNELSITQTHLEDVQTHTQVLQILLEVYRETATPEQVKLFRKKMYRLLDHYDAVPEMEGGRDIVDLYFFLRTPTDQ